MSLGALPIVGGVAAFSFIAGAFDRIKDAFYRLYSVFVVTVRVDGHASYAVSMYLHNHFKRSRIGDIDIDGFNDYVRPEKRNMLVALRLVSYKKSIWWRGWKPIAVTKNWDRVTLSFVRGLFNPIEMIAEAVCLPSTSGGAYRRIRGKCPRNAANRRTTAHRR